MNGYLIGALFVAWFVFVVINYSWVQALKEKRGTFDNDGDADFMIMLFGPVGSLVLLLVTFTPPFSKWMKDKFKGIV